MFKYLLLSFLGIGLSGCSIFSGKDNTEPPAPLVNFSPTLTLKTVWTARTGSNVSQDYLRIGPTFHDEQLLITSPQGQVQALNFKEGNRIWTQQLEVPISSSAGVGENLILVGSHKGDVVALSATDGKEIWRTQVSSEVLVPPQISQGVVVVRTADGKLFGLTSQNGKQLWVYERSTVPLLTLRGTSTPLVVNDLIIAGFDNGKLAALELHTGKVLWEAPIAVPSGRTELERMVDIDADPLLANKVIYVSSYQGRTVAIDLLQGKLLWERDIFSYVGLGIDDHALYVTDTKSHIWALDRNTGASLWKQTQLQARGLTAPVSIGDYVVVGDKEGYLHWLQRDNGQFAARYRLSHYRILVPPLVVGDTLVAYDSRGQLVVLQPN
ncbi:beta-barrel assembly machine subunit BamB [Thioploca ingrica]|uniref:Outer membrane protein assembly factor BamB n=1 Tax=Thioploca ingrica TaxID=40754 RepID=A0A090AH85_9GAMM|nr:beta-barrel assembly machine subunit BamB [Thioploca ingrica]